MRPPGGARPKGGREGPEGEISVQVSDEQTMPLDLPRWQRLAEEVLRAEGVTGDAELSLLFVDEANMAELNERFLAKTGATDVLAFPLEGDLIDPGRYPDGGAVGPDREPPAMDELPLLLGDVVVCPAVAERNAPAHAGTPDDELALLVVHGVLHVLGMDHAEPSERRAMQAREREHLQRFWRLPPRDPWDALGGSP